MMSICTKRNHFQLKGKSSEIFMVNIVELIFQVSTLDKKKTQMIFHIQTS